MRAKLRSRRGRSSWITAAGLMVITCGVATATAQTPKGDLAGGYAYLHEPGLSVPAGWFLSAGASANNWFGVVGTVTGHYKSEAIGTTSVETRLHTFMGGPKLTYRTERFRALRHAPCGRRTGRGEGVAAAGATATASETRLAAHTGVGVDVSLSNTLGARVGVNRLYIRGDEWDDWTDDFQFIAGAVLRW